MNILDKIDKYLEEEAPEKAITGTRDLVNKNPKLSDKGTTSDVCPTCGIDTRQWVKKQANIPVDTSGAGASVNPDPQTNTREWFNKQANVKP